MAQTRTSTMLQRRPWILLGLVAVVYTTTTRTTSTVFAPVAAFPVISRRVTSSSPTSSTGSLLGNCQGYLAPRQQQCFGSSPGVLAHPWRSGRTIRQGSISNDNDVTTGSSTSSTSSPSTDRTKTTGITVSWFYASLWITFLIYGLVASPGQVGDPLDMQLLQSYIDNPTAPQGINALFLLIFNGLGVMPLILAQLACPQGNKVGGVPAAPCLVASLAMGFGAAGIYLTFRSPPVTHKTQDEASWVTRTILESKLTSLVSLLLLGLSITTALGTAAAVPLVDTSITTWSSVVSDYVVLASQSKFVSVSSLDLVMLTIVAATLIPRDLQLRTMTTNNDNNDNGNDQDTSALALGQTIAVGTLFFPILGAALYCLWRPPLPTK